MNILSIQSAVTYGHVGNSAAVFPLQRIGHEVWPIYTVNYSNHTGYGAWEGPIIPASDVSDIINGVDERGALERVDAILTGYQGSDEIGDVIVDAVARVKDKNPSALYTCDPVMGSATSGCFVADTIPPMLRDRVVPVADIITPNQFELGYLTESEATDLDSTLKAVAAARAMGPKTVLVTSVERPDVDNERFIEMIAVDDKGSWTVRTPRLPLKFNGSGDVAAALFTGHYIQSHDAADALARTASSLFDLINATYEAQSRELLLVQSQEVYANPRMQFEVESL